MPWVEKRRRSDRPDDSGDILGEKRAALVGCRRSGYALSPAAHRLILIVTDDLPVGKGMAPVRCASPHPSTLQLAQIQEREARAPDDGISSAYSPQHEHVFDVPSW
jgi:hypothetical protein